MDECGQTGELQAEDAAPRRRWRLTRFQHGIVFGVLVAMVGALIDRDMGIVVLAVFALLMGVLAGLIDPD